MLMINLYVFFTVNYNMYLEYADDPTDSTYLRNKPLKFALGTGKNRAPLIVCSKHLQ